MFCNSQKKCKKLVTIARTPNAIILSWVGTCAILAKHLSGRNLGNLPQKLGQLGMENQNVPGKP